MTDEAPTDWLELCVSVAQRQTEQVENLLLNLGALAVSLEDAGEDPQYEPAPDSTPLWDQVQVVGLFAGATERQPLLKRLQECLGIGILEQTTFRTLADQPWERAWLEHFHPMSFGERLWICPRHLAVDQPDAVVVRLDPGLAFGTGTHPTTALCLGWLDAHPPTGLNVLDFGCGSGILAIAAAQLGARKIWALDHDPQALTATAENAADNGVGQIIQCLGRNQLPEASADLVLANILASTLIELREVLLNQLAPGGTLVLSGILEHQADQVIAAYQSHIGLHRQVMDTWVLLHGTRSI